MDKRPVYFKKNSFDHQRPRYPKGYDYAGAFRPTGIGLVKRPHLRHLTHLERRHEDLVREHLELNQAYHDRPHDLAMIKRQSQLRRNISELHDRRFLVHRDLDPPHAISQQGKMSWFRANSLHRDGDLPARIHPDGTSEYMRHGKLHRDGGRPAVVHACGKLEYWEHGRQIRIEA